MINRICKWIVFKLLYPVCYYLGSIRKIDVDKILFVENHSHNLSGNYTLLFEEFKKLGYNVKVHYLKVSTASWLEIIRHSLLLIWDMSNARCIFLNESNSLFGTFALRKDTKMIQLWHACGAFKKWGYSVADKSFGEDKKSLERYSGHRNYDLVAVSGEAVCWAYEEAFGLQNRPEVVKPYGVSRTDVYYSDLKKQQVRQLLQNYENWIQGRKIVLYAPTFRGDIKTAQSPGILDFHELSELRDEYVFLIKQHPFVKEGYKIPYEYSDYCMDIGDKLSIEDLLIAADVCVTDYSSIVFEYSLMRKPIIFLAHDLDEYYDERGFYYPYEEFVPGPIVKTTKALVEQIQNLPAFDQKRIDEFATKYMSGCDGKSTKRIVEYVLHTY